MSSKLIISTLFLLLFNSLCYAESPSLPKTDAAENAEVYFITPKDGEIFECGKVLVTFGLKNMGVAPAGVDVKNTGHHHLLINQETLPDMNMPLPATDQIKHFGGGQTQVELDLPAGKHTLQLLLGDKNHIPHIKPVISEKITVIVQD